MKFIGSRDSALLISVCMCLLCVSLPSNAQDGMYPGVELGAFSSRDMDVWGSANDVATARDEF